MDAFFASAAEYFQGSGSGFVSVFCTVWRYLAPVLADAAAVALCPAAAEIPAGAGDVGMARHAGRVISSL